jgi:transcriptional regulator NrdR family protein
MEQLTSVKDGIMNHIVKRHGHTEPYDEKKLYASIYSACLSVREPAGSAELIAEKVVSDISTWLQKKHEVTANDIRRHSSVHLKAYNPDAAYMFMHHRVIW